MFVRFRQTPRRLQASLVETRRSNGKVRHEHIASLGSVAGSTFSPLAGSSARELSREIAMPHFFLSPNRAGYEEFRAIMDDRDEIPPTFDEWEKNIKRRVAEAKAHGLILEPVSFDPKEFLAFCRSNNLPCGDQARAHFAATIGRARTAN
jgi:hypothetical protein